jgi:hypothetical protein
MLVSMLIPITANEIYTPQFQEELDYYKGQKGERNEVLRATDVGGRI